MPALTGEERQRNRRVRRQQVEGVESAGGDVFVRGNARIAQSLRVRDAFLVEQVEGSDPDPGGRQAGQVGTPAGNLPSGSRSRRMKAQSGPRTVSGSRSVRTCESLLNVAPYPPDRAQARSSEPIARQTEPCWLVGISCSEISPRTSSVGCSNSIRSNCRQVTG